MSDMASSLMEPVGEEAELYLRLPNGRIQCTACARRCQLREGQVGLCGVRGVVNGKLYLLVYGRVIAANVEPIEKKPVLHYRPGSMVFSIGTTGCDFLCRYCINYEISQRRRVEGEKISPQGLVATALAHGADGMAYTYNEPTIFMEYARDTGRLAHSNGLFNIFVSNGFGTPESVGLMRQFLDCITVDFKGSGETEFVRKYIGIPDVEPIFQTLLELRDRTSIHVEITDLVVPRVGDSLTAARRLVGWVYDNLGPDVPVNFLRFFPSYKMMDLPPTPIETLERHYRVAKDEGLRYVHLGNVPGHPAESTYCPGCSKVLVWRAGYSIREYNLDSANRCKFCGYKTSIVGPLSASVRMQRFIPVIGELLEF